MFSKIKSYVQDSVELAKLEGVEAVSKVVANIAYVVLLLLFAFFFVLIGSFAAGYYLSTVYDRTVGFLIVTGFYLLLLILFFIFKKQFINFVVNMAIAASSKSKK